MTKTGYGTSETARAYLLANVIYLSVYKPHDLKGYFEDQLPPQNTYTATYLRTPGYPFRTSAPWT